MADDGVARPGVDVMEARLGMCKKSSSVEALEEVPPVKQADGINAGKEVVEDDLSISCALMRCRCRSRNFARRDFLFIFSFGIKSGVMVQTRLDDDDEDFFDGVEEPPRGVEAAEADKRGSIPFKDDDDPSSPPPSPCCGLEAAVFEIISFWAYHMCFSAQYLRYFRVCFKRSIQRISPDPSVLPIQNVP